MTTCLSFDWFAFYDILAPACLEMKILEEKVTYVFRLFDF